MSRAVKLLKESSEADSDQLYNLARAVHGLGITDLAAMLYRDILSSPTQYRWKCEAAYNLHIILVQSGSIDEAQRILEQHIRF